jgi:hypothetical protein
MACILSMVLLVLCSVVKPFKKKINSDHNNFVLFDFWFDIFGLQNRLCQHKT